MAHKATVLFITGLPVLLAALVCVSFQLNVRQCRASLQAIRADLGEVMRRDIATLNDRVKKYEDEKFRLFEHADLPLDVCLASRLFIIREGRVIPAGLPAVSFADTIDSVVAGKALALGGELIATGRQDKAVECMATAARVAVKDKDDLRIKAEALAGLLELAEYRSLGSTFSLLYVLFDYPGVRLDDADVKNFENRLREHMPDYERLKTQSRELWRTAGELSGRIRGQNAPFKVVAGDSIISANTAGHAFLFPAELKKTVAQQLEIELGTTPPGETVAISRQLRFLPLYAWLPLSQAETRKQAVEQSFFMMNIFIGFLLVITAGMAWGIAVTLKREREIAGMRTNFVAAVSHELRTPLSLIRLYAETAGSNRSTPDVKERYLRSLIAEIDRLTGLVNNILDFSRLEQDAVRIRLKDTDISALCGEVLDSFSYRLEKDGFKVERKLAPGLSAQVDPLIMTQVIFNLVDNAIKYSGNERGFCVETEARDNGVVARVKDNGIGIPDSMKERIFLPFVRGDDVRVTSQRGSGIGLSVVSQFLTRMGGSIRAYDNKPRGTVFEVVLPGKKKEP